MQQAESIQSIDSVEVGELTRPAARRNGLAHRRERGAMLLAVLFLMAMMVLAALAVAPAFIQQAKRDREEEMIHRGTEYARAVKRYYKKFGRYPANMEQLVNTNQMRFLRQRYTDPLVPDGQWKLLHYGDVQALLGLGGFAMPAAQQALQTGAPGFSPQSAAGASGLTGQPNNIQGANPAPPGAQLSPEQLGVLANHVAAAGQDTGSPPPLAGSGAAVQSDTGQGLSTGQPGGVGGSQSGNIPGQAGSNNTIFGNTGVGGQTFGGGAIVGVASKSKDPTIRVFNKKKKYDEWQFFYSPIFDRQNTLLRGPYNGLTITPSQVGIPAGQLNQSGQQPGTQGVQGPLQDQQQNQQQNQQLGPPTQFPPDQTQPQ